MLQILPIVAWSYRIVTHNPQLVTAKPSKLDAKRANNFNEAVVSHFFDKLEHIYDEYGDIPPEHIYNMDEKGIQIGGGRKNNGRACMYFQDQRNRYKIFSGNLELVILHVSLRQEHLLLQRSFFLMVQYPTFRSFQLIAFQDELRNFLPTRSSNVSNNVILHDHPMKFFLVTRTLPALNT